MKKVSGKKTGLRPGSTTVKDLSIAIQSGAEGSTPVTARLAGELHDMELPISPREVGAEIACRNLAKAINVAFQNDFLPTELEPAYRAARARAGRVELLHREWIGLGDGVLAQIGRTLRSIRLTFQGPDPASPEGKKRIAAGERGAMKGLASLLARKLNLVQEYEDMVPTFVEQMLDRLESVRLVTGWRREEWSIETTSIGLDVHIAPLAETVTEPAAAASGARAADAAPLPRKRSKRR
ncbi:MAG: hypothetical protein JNM84_03715 [Planctomycetes bacterium]|nr:hypothetical protein [Planctomycetota bacterium]